jgi:putative salt-induced outer membrane protein
MLYLFLSALFLSVNVWADYKNESEFALVKTGGNSEVQTTNTKTTNTYTWGLNQLKSGGHYIYGETSNGVSARNWDFNNKYERELSQKFSYAFGEIIEGNSFIGLKARYNSDIGAKYYYIRSDAKNFFSELGYRYAIEDRYSPERNTFDNKGRFYNEINQKLSETVQYKLWLEYVPNFTQPKDYLVNGEASLTSILSSIFSLKVSYLGTYDNRPAQKGFKNYDFTSTTSIVAKF